MQGELRDESSTPSMSALIYGFRQQLSACSPPCAIDAKAASSENCLSSGECELKDDEDRSQILPVGTSSFDTSMDAKIAQKRSRGTAGCAIVPFGSDGSSRRKGRREKDLNWFNNPCEYGYSTYRSAEGGVRGESRSRSRVRPYGGAPQSLLEASKVDVGAEMERSSSRSRSSTRQRAINGDGSCRGSVTSGAVSSASYARDLYSTTSVGSKFHKATRSKSPTMVTFEPSVASSTMSKNKPPKVPKPMMKETLLPTKLHGLVMELSSLSDTSSRKRTALAWRPILERLLNRPNEASSLDRRYRTPLSLACEFGNDVPIEVIRSLVDANPDAAFTPDKKGCYPIHYYLSSDRGGMWRRSADVLEILIDANANAALKTNKLGQTPLLAAMQSCPSCLLGVTREDRGERSTEYEARVAMLKCMFEANPLAASIPDKTYTFPLHYASKKGPNQALLPDLIHQCPAALAARDNFGATPLLLAVHWDAEMYVLRTLLRACPSVLGVRDRSGETALSHLWNSLVHSGKTDTREERHRVNANRRAINEATSLRSLENSPIVLDRWRKIELLLRALHLGVVDGGDESGGSPRGTPRWMPVHGTCGTTVPLELVRFVMQIFPGDVSVSDDSGRLPLHIAASVPGYIKLPFEKKKSRKKLQKNDDARSLERKTSKQYSILGHLLDAYPRGAATMDHAGRLPLHYAAIAGRAWSAIDDDGEEGGMGELVKAEPRAVRTREGKSGLFPFMFLAMRDDERGPHRSYKERRARAEQRARNAIFLTESGDVTTERWEATVQDMMEREEAHEMDSLYHLIRLTPDILALGLSTTSNDKKNSDDFNEEVRVDNEHPIRRESIGYREQDPAAILSGLRDESSKYALIQYGQSLQMNEYRGCKRVQGSSIRSPKEHGLGGHPQVSKFQFSVIE